MTLRPPLALCAALLAVSACSRSRAESSPPKTSPPVSTITDQGITIPADSPQLARILVAPVQTARMPAAVLEAPGKVEADPSRVSKVVLPAAGRISRVMVRLGDAVERGAPLLTIDSPEIGATLSAYRQAQARVGQARAAQTKADADLARAQDLFENQAIAQKEVLAAQSATAQARADIEQAESAVNEARQKLQIFGITPEASDQTIVVRAPVAGKVLDLTVVAGEYRNDTSAPLMTIADLSSVFVTADVPETQIRLVREGTDVDVSLAAYPDETFHAKVSRIADTVDSQTRTIKVRSTLPNPRGRFRPDMFGQIHYSADFKDLPVVPTSAVVRDEDRTQVYQEEGPGRFRGIPVVLGTRTGDRVAVVQGVQAGDRIVVDGAMLLVRR
jgi:cobalt-zinc-cadmium efflux system membrane fusion protein